MKQLTGVDVGFLVMETPNTYGHVNGLSIYERPSPDFDPFQAVYERFGSIIGHLEPFRRRVVDVPFGLDHPYWIDDADFDRRMQLAELDYMTSSEAGLTMIAENYVGLPVN